MITKSKKSPFINIIKTKIEIILILQSIMLKLLILCLFIITNLNVLKNNHKSF
jgi:hypothetical protein